MVAVACAITACNKKEKEAEVVVPEPVKQEVYQPKHQSSKIELSALKKYNYYNAPTTEVAKGVLVKYDPKSQYTTPIEVVFSYANGDTYTYIIPEFGIWQNEAGKLRIVTDKDATVWLQGQTKKGSFQEFVFYGNPKYNGTKIKPNSYLNAPDGKIEYRK